MDDEDIDKALEQFASDVAEALGHALRASDKEWKIPLLPLTIGLDRLTGKRHNWRSWHIRFTCERRRNPYSARSALMQLDDEQINELATGFTDALREPLMRTYNDRYPFVPLMVGTGRYKGHVNKKRWWAWEIRFTWVRER